MADPLVAAAIYAETRGMLDFRSCDGTAAWWAGARIRIRQARSEMDRQRLHLRAQQLFSSISAGKIDPGEANKLVGQYEQRVCPWLRTQQARTSDVLDLVARWYILNAPQRLRDLGVDFGRFEPDSG